MYEQLIPFLTFLSVVALGGAVLTARAKRQQAIRDRLQKLEAQANKPEVCDDRSWLTRLFGHLGSMAASEGPSTALRSELSRAGYHGRNAAVVYLGIKISLLIVGLTTLTAFLLPSEALTLLTKAILIPGIAGVLFFIPNMVVRHQRNRRATEVRAHLPDTIDLLEVCVSAGMGLDMAWNSVADELRGISPTLADEMALTNLEIHLGAQRATAMRHMADRTGAQEISSLVGALVQSDRFGTSIADALRTYATSMREIRSQQAEEAAEKMPVKLIFPLALLIFPALLIVISGPAVIEWVKIIGSS